MVMNGQRGPKTRLPAWARAVTFAMLALVLGATSISGTHSHEASDSQTMRCAVCHLAEQPFREGMAAATAPLLGPIIVAASPSRDLSHVDAVADDLQLPRAPPLQL